MLTTELSIDIFWIPDARTQYLTPEKDFRTTVFRFNNTRLPKTEEILKITKLMNCINFRIIFQAVMTCFGRSADKRIQENSNDASRYYLYSIVNKRWMRTSPNDLNKILDKWKNRHYTRLGVQQSVISPWKEKNKKPKILSCYNARYSSLVSHPSGEPLNRA